MQKVNDLWFRIRSVKCACGEMRVARGTRTELAGVSHGESPCFFCDEHGNMVRDLPRPLR